MEDNIMVYTGVFETLPGRFEVHSYITQRKRNEHDDI